MTIVSFVSSFYFYFSNDLRVVCAVVEFLPSLLSRQKKTKEININKPSNIMQYVLVQSCLTNSSAWNFGISATYYFACEEFIMSQMRLYCIKNPTNLLHFCKPCLRVGNVLHCRRSKP